MNDSPNSDSQASRRTFLQKRRCRRRQPHPSRVHAAGTGIIHVGAIGCGGRGEAAAMNAGPDVHIGAMSEILLDRFHEKRTALTLKYPDPVDVPDLNCFAGFDAYKHVIEARDVAIIANPRQERERSRPTRLPPDSMGREHAHHWHRLQDWRVKNISAQDFVGRSVGLVGGLTGNGQP